jgi:hypothetical protein
MAELIKGLVQVRDALSLIAFLGLVLLAAFRTKKVPELLFGLFRDKLTRQQFSALLHRFMTLGLIAFLALVTLAVVAQVLNHLTQPTALTVVDLRRELAAANRAEDEKIHAEAQYNLAMEKLSQHDLNGAITSLQDSINAIPTLTAREMLIYLYRQKHDTANEAAAWEEAVKMARKRGDPLTLARLDRVSVPAAVPDAEGEHDLIGKSLPLPKGGDQYETAAEIAPGFYSFAATQSDGGECRSCLFKIYLHGGQRLKVKFRSPLSGGLAGAAIFGTNGQPLKDPEGDQPNSMHGNAAPGGTIRELDWNASESGWYFLRATADPGTVYRIRVD